MANLNDTLIDIKEKLQTIADIKTVGIGLEKGLGSKDCPFIRVVSNGDAKDGGYRKLDINIVFGFDIKNRDIELMYKSMYELEEKIIETLQYNLSNGDCFYNSTQTDGDMLQNIKSSISNFTINNITI